MEFDKVSKKKATDCTPESAVISLNVTKTTDPITKKVRYLAPAGYDASSSDDVHSCDDVMPYVTAIGYSNNRLVAQVNQGTHPLQTVEFKVGGSVVGSVPLGSSGEASIAYNGSGKADITVTVTDTALNSASKTEADYKFPKNND